MLFQISNNALTLSARISLVLNDPAQDFAPAKSFGQMWLNAKVWKKSLHGEPRETSWKTGRGWSSIIRTGIFLGFKSAIYDSKSLPFYSKFDLHQIFYINNFHKKFGSAFSKIADFFLLSNFSWSFL